MSRWLTEKARIQGKQLRRFGEKSQQHQMAFEQEIPVKEEKKLKVMIGGIGSHEDETARMQGFQFFVLKSKTSERLMVKIAKVNREFALAEKVNDTGGEK